MTKPLPYLIPLLEPTTENVSAMRERFENVLGLVDGRGSDYYFDQRVHGTEVTVEVWGFLHPDSALLFRWPA